MPLGSDAFLRRHPADPTLTELCSPSQPLVLIVTTVRSPTYAQFSTAATAQAATPTGGATSSVGVSSGVHQEAVRAGEIRRCLGATHIQVPRHLRVKQVCAGLLAHSVTSKYINSLATIAKTNSIRPCREALQRQSSAARTAANIADHQSRDPFGCIHLTPDNLQNSEVSANACRAASAGGCAGPARWVSARHLCDGGYSES